MERPHLRAAQIVNVPECRTERDHIADASVKTPNDRRPRARSGHRRSEFVNRNVTAELPHAAHLVLMPSHLAFIERD